MKKKNSWGKVLTMSESALTAFSKRRKELLRLSIVSLLMTFIALAIVGTRLFYPFHMVVGLTVYALSFIPLVRRVYVGRATWKTYRAYTETATYFKREKWRFVLALCLIVVSATFLYLRPLDRRPFAGLSDTELAARINDDLYTSVTAMDYLESTGNTLLATLSRGEADVNTTEDIAHAFEEFLRAVAFSESLTDEHRYFAGIPYHMERERITSFLIAYSLYAKKYEITHRIMLLVSEDDYRKKALNQQFEEFGRNNLYDEMVVRYFAPKTRVRLLGGYYYLKLFARKGRNSEQGYELLREKGKESYTYLRSHVLTTVAYTGEVFADTAERRMFDAWFPIQKTVATAMGRAILTTRGKDGFITAEQALAMGEVMVPGDLMLQRRNWHVSNVGIPGFWTHSALYTGDLATVDEYFASEFPYRGHTTFSELLATEYAAVYARYLEPDKDGRARAVVEAIEPGVVLQSLPVSADADFVVVLRPNLSKRDVLEALLKAFSHVGKPYDFDFDFATRDTLVCSELLYDSYFPREDKRGLRFETSTVNGRSIVSPLDIAEKYVRERGTPEAELSYVYFLRGNEQAGTARLATEPEFVDSLSWSKFSFFQQ